MGALVTRASLSSGTRLGPVALPPSMAEHVLWFGEPIR